ncbi:MAG: hypothetical protein ACREFE_10800 [Limisphaerales bacterium]
MNNAKSNPMPKAKTEKAWMPKWLPDWANEPLTFAVHPDESLRRCAYTRLPASRKKSVKTRLKSR